MRIDLINLKQTYTVLNVNIFIKSSLFDMYIYFLVVPLFVNFNCQIMVFPIKIQKTVTKLHNHYILSG